MGIERQRGKDSVERSTEQPERVMQEQPVLMQRQPSVAQSTREASIADAEGQRADIVQISRRRGFWGRFVLSSCRKDYLGF